jgi:hypothetical protein
VKNLKKLFQKYPEITLAKNDFTVDHEKAIYNTDMIPSRITEHKNDVIRDAQLSRKREDSIP